ncbi:MAG: peptide-methionine (S)-S-oxide reductase MsrA [Herminiimonas sp.]|nr:peptide-methionine (S)-S-oxide reductase MsrA [Herminiimonas sp.]
MVVLLGAATGTALSRASSDDFHLVPAFAPIAPAAREAITEEAVLAGGCFWGVQGVFQHVKGVTNAVSGYAGGAQASARYREVGSGDTGHAEAVRVTFDPRQISYARILQIYFSVAHNPTELNRQGPDSGTQYRSALFPVNPEQARIAKAYIAQLDKGKVFKAPIATTIEPAKPFYAAEDYHQDYLSQHPNEPYIMFNDLPKVDALKRMFPDQYRADPVLVSATVARK